MGLSDHITVTIDEIRVVDQREVLQWPRRQGRSWLSWMQWAQQPAQQAALLRQLEGVHTMAGSPMWKSGLGGSSGSRVGHADYFARAMQQAQRLETPPEDAPPGYLDEAEDLGDNIIEEGIEEAKVFVRAFLRDVGGSDSMEDDYEVGDI